MSLRISAVLFAGASLLLLAGPAAARPDRDALLRLAERLEARREAGRGAAFVALRDSQSPAVVTLRADEGVSLMFVEQNGFPRYYGLENVNAAQTLSTDKVHPGAGFGFSLSGAGMTLGRLAVWDGGAVRTAHVELTGRATQMDGASSFSSHSTHVAGTMIGAGVDANAKGMSYEGRLACYDWNSDNSEMASAAAGILSISNHSYGYITGWRYSDPDWYWYGDMSISTAEDYGFGFYSADAAAWDQIAYDAPEYLIVASAGNDRGDGPSPGTTHYHYDGGWVQSNDVHPVDGGALGYDSVSWNKNAKNILSIGAVYDVPGGWTAPGDVTMSSFSGWGPTDDGRIKPDLSANGISLYSSIASSNTAYASYSGTSMASPNASGSINLVREHWEAAHGFVPRAATLKAVLVQTADECGADDGPDYQFGWGLINTLSAVQLISDDAAVPPGEAQVWEASLANGQTDVYYLNLAADGPVTVTVAWTDLPGDPPSDELDPTDPMLVNDLDVRLRAFGAGPVVGEPWTLDPANPADAAVPGDNVVDVTERIDAADVPAGFYEVAVSHKGTLVDGPQAYSLVVSVPVTDVPPGVAAPEIAAAAAAEEAIALRAAPNPFRTATTLSFSLAASGDVRVAIHDVTGRRVRELASARMDAGTHRLDWDGRDASGNLVPAGVYFARVATPEGVRSQALVASGR